MYLGQIGLEFQRLLVADGGLGQFALFAQGIAKVHVRFGKTGL